MRVASLCCCPRGRFDLGARFAASAGGLLLQSLLQLPGAVGEAVLLAGETPDCVLPGVAILRSRQFGRHLALGVGKLSRFELEIPDGAPPFVGTAPLELAFELPQLVERLAAARAGLLGVLPTQVARCVPHRL